MIIGPGDVGAYDHSRYATAVASQEIDQSSCKMIRSFVMEVQAGDIIILRRGQRAIAIGRAHDDGYQWNPTFDDVYGWDLQHSRRVLWQDQLQSDLEAAQAVEGIFTHRTIMPRWSRVDDPKVLGSLSSILGKLVDRKLRDLPRKPPEPLTDEELGEALFRRGLGNVQIDQLIQTLKRQRRLLKWYRAEQGPNRPNEHEVVAYMVVPLLLALGWSEQLMGVEWQKVDLATFGRTPTTHDWCSMVCEAKNMETGLQEDLEQAVRYTEKLKLTNCGKILLTQGGRFYLFGMWSKSDGALPDASDPSVPQAINANVEAGGPPRVWPTTPAGYINIERLRTNHLAPANTNAVATLMGLTPTYVPIPRAVFP
jgi:hypothetical protein